MAGHRVAGEGSHGQELGASRQEEDCERPEEQPGEHGALLGEDERHHGRQILACVGGSDGDGLAYQHESSLHWPSVGERLQAGYRSARADRDSFRV
ncbi:Hypothetical protein A7982_00039 [Minicystis rosea]|nr:Hypothetical protein A7982_00039 [Minicystis rosea]